MPVFNNILAGSSGQGDTGYEIEQSVRFDEDNSSAYLYRTPSGAGNRKTFTISFWFKYCPNADTGDFFIFEAGTGNSPANYCYLEIYQEKLYFRDATSGSTNWEFQTSQLFRDVSAWYHCVIAVDTTQASSSNRVKIYLNGSQITAFGTETQPSQDYDSHVNNTVQHAIGASKLASNHYFDGYLAEFHLIDGTALTPASFGETNSNTNQWQAIEYDGSYGTNGFYQKYAATGGHTSFTSSGSWTAPTGVTSVDYLVVGGGGGGASGSGGGGGGAGAFRSGTLSVTPGTTYSITVGAGGAGGSNSVGANGSDSVFSSITSNGGGGGGTSSGSANGNASGGGGGNGGSAGAGGTYGNAGGAGGSSLVGGGGGGASAAGTAGVGDPYWGYGHGGAGSASSITGSSVTYSGGGGGGVGRSGAGGNGGSGGGGSGAASSQTPGNGTANTGGGGGGSNATSQAGGTGGSGIVVIKIAAGFGLGLDSSGNGNNFTETNLVATDQVLDSPTNNFCTLNPLNPVTGTFSEGNLKYAGPGGWNQCVKSTMEIPNTGKWGFRVDYSGNASGSAEGSVFTLVGVCKTSQTAFTGGPDFSEGLWYSDSGYVYNFSSTAQTETAISNGDYVEMLIDSDANSYIFKLNGTSVNNGTIGTTDPISVVIQQYNNSYANPEFDFGQRGYEPSDSDYKTLCTDNLPDPAIADSTAHFDTTLVSGNGSNRSITGLNFQPDFLWGKSRTNTLNHYLTDSVRGVNSQLYSDGTGAQGTETVIYTAFNSDGFSLGTGDMNTSGQNYVHWAWKGGGTASTNENGTIDSSVSANTTAGFSIVNWNGTEASATVGHGLSQAPELIIVKDVDSARGWPSNIENITGTSNQYLLLNDTDSAATSSAYWGGTPGASVFTVGDSANTNDDASMIAYCFHSVEGYSKIGSYTGNGSKVFIYTGFKPAYLLVKEYANTSSWYIQDNKRNTYNEVKAALYANLNSAEDSAGVFSDFVSNGFVAINDGSSGASNVSGRSYIYLAFAESPFKYSNAR